jgi:shikimate kinase
VRAEKIYLVGFMGAGKSTLARALAARLGWRAVDVDELIEAREGQSVAAVFARHGEGYFRAVERAVLHEQLGTPHLIVATGGGTFVDPLNRAAINQDGVSIWLDLPNRAEFERLFHARRAAYGLAHMRLDAGRASVDELVEQLTDWLGV